MVQSKGKLMPQWNSDETKSIISSVNNILAGGNGNMDSYDPNKINKVSASLSMVDDLAHGVSADDMESKYLSMPDDLKEGLHQSAYKVNLGGSMGALELMKEAKNNNIKLSDAELDKLEMNPGVQRKYLNVKTSSKSVPTETMELEIESIIEDYDNGKIKNKGNLTTRLQNILRDVSSSDLDFTVNNIWDTLTKNTPQYKRKREILENNKELNGFEDRTWQEKNLEMAEKGLDAIGDGVLNVLEWVTKQAIKGGVALTPKSDLLAQLGGNESAEDIARNYLMNVNLNNLSPETRIDVQNARDMILGKEIFDAWSTYKNALEESSLSDVDELFDQLSSGWSKSFPGDIKKNEQQLEGSNYAGAGEFVGKTIDLSVATHLVSEMFTSLVGDIFMNGGGTEAVQKFLETAQKTKSGRLAQDIIKWGNALTEGSAFSIVDEGELDPWSILTYMGITRFFDAVSGSATEFLEKTNLRSVLGKEGLEKAVNTLRQKGYTVKDALHSLTDLFVKFGERGGKENMELITKDALSQLDNGLKEMLGGVSDEFDIELIKKMADFLVGKGTKGIEDWSVEGTRSLIRNRLVPTLGEDGANEIMSIIEKIGNQNGNKVSLRDAYIVRQVFGWASNAWNKNGAVKSPESSQILNDWFMSSMKEITKLFDENGGAVSDNLSKKGFSGIGDIMNVEEIMSIMLDSLGKNPTEGFLERFAKSSLKFLSGGFASSSLKEAGAEGFITNPYVDTSIISSIVAGVTNPKWASRFLRVLGRTSFADRYSLVNGILSSNSKEVAQQYIRTWIDNVLGDLGTEFIMSLEDEFFGNKSELNKKSNTKDEDVKDTVSHLDKRKQDILNNADIDLGNYSLDWE